MNTEQYDNVCKAKFEEMSVDQKETKATVITILKKLENGITERLDDYAVRMNRLEALVVKILLAIIGLFGTFVIGVVILLIKWFLA